MFVSLNKRKEPQSKSSVPLLSVSALSRVPPSFAAFLLLSFTVFSLTHSLSILRTISVRVNQLRKTRTPLSPWQPPQLCRNTSWVLKLWGCLRLHAHKHDTFNVHLHSLARCDTHTLCELHYLLGFSLFCDWENCLRAWEKEIEREMVALL